MLCASRLPLNQHRHSDGLFVAAAPPLQGRACCGVGPKRRTHDSTLEKSSFRTHKDKAIVGRLSSGLNWSLCKGDENNAADHGNQGKSRLTCKKKLFEAIVLCSNFHCRCSFRIQWT